MSETKHPIQIVSRRTGLSADVIRAWERRYKAVKPSRSANGRRLYSDNDVKKLMLLQRIISGGRRIGDIAKLNIKNLESLIESDESATVVKTSLAKQITEKLKIPTIGIGSSVYCDGQVLVTDDLIGLNNTNIKFVKKFINIKKYINLGFKKFSSEVKSKKYPLKKHSY